MFCVVNYSKCLRKWYIAFHNDDGLRNDRNAEYFDDKVEANNRVCELMVDEGIRFVQISFEYRIKAEILSKLRDVENRKTYTEHEEAQRQGELAVLEELVNIFNL